MKKILILFLIVNSVAFAAEERWWWSAERSVNITDAEFTIIQNCRNFETIEEVEENLAKYPEIFIKGETTTYPYKSVKEIPTNEKSGDKTYVFKDGALVYWQYSHDHCFLTIKF
jgi:hypothetical protein